MWWLFVPAAYAVTVMALPFPNWRSLGVVLTATLSSREITLRERASMLLYIIRDMALLPIWAIFWLIDEVFFSGYHTEKIRDPIFIISQPRSGTTLLLRTLSEDRNTFLSVKHLEWRYPYISFWKLIEVLGLRQWLEARSYWPDTPLGRTCRKIHYHVLGNYEEFGIFLEERFYHHYFVFRRFPFAKVLNRVSGLENLSVQERNRMIATFRKVVQKVYFHRGQGEIFIAKENECIEFCNAMISTFKSARIVFVCRDPAPMLESYLTMSLTCTQVKHGVDPRKLAGWHERNIEFRRQECRKFVAIASKRRADAISILVSFQDLTTSMPKTIKKIYAAFGLDIGQAFAAYLDDFQTKQSTRDKGYTNLPCDEDGFDFYSAFVNINSQEHVPLEAEA